MQYDYIICGAGAAGLLLAYRMAQDDFFANQQILLLDKEEKNTNDRTWCFWEAPEGEWDFLTHKIWDWAYFASKDYARGFELQPFQYKMLRGEDFYRFVKKEIAEATNISFRHEEILEAVTEGDQTRVTTEQKTYYSKRVFSSLFHFDEVKKHPKFPLLQQHFVGWFIETKEPVFDKNTVGFMDFDIPQKGNTRFMYVLPTSPTEALLEYTLFSPEILSQSEYEAGIKAYLAEKGISEYTITETEKGNIPMTCYPFWKKNTASLLHVGTAGGWTKSSTGFTFMNTLRKTTQLIDFLKTDKPLDQFHQKTRFWYYDLLFIDVLHADNSLGSRLFERLFRRNKTSTIFKFLDEKSSLSQEVLLMVTLPNMLFLKALWKRLFR